MVVVVENLCRVLYPSIIILLLFYRTPKRFLCALSVSKIMCQCLSEFNFRYSYIMNSKWIIHHDYEMILTYIEKAYPDIFGHQITML